MSQTPSHLCYIDAAHVQSPLGELGGFHVVDAGDRNLGSLVGIVADLPARRVCYWVVALRGWLGSRRYQLIPFGPARLEANQHAVRLESDRAGLGGCRELESETFPNFSDEHLLAALW